MFSLPLFLNDIGGSEIILIMLVVLMFFGSKSIPGIAKTFGRTLYEFRNATSELQNEIKKSGFDIKNDMKLENILQETTEPILQPMDQVFTDIENTVHFETKKTNNLADVSQSKTEENSSMINEKTSENEGNSDAIMKEEQIEINEDILLKKAEK